MFISKETLENLRKSYPAGARVELVYMGDDPYSKLIPGDRGTVKHVDDTGSIHISWDKGSSLAALYGVDTVKRVYEKRKIWSYDIGDPENWREAWEDGEELDENELKERAEDLNADYLDDERTNLNVYLSESIIAIGRIGRWNGTFDGYKIIESCALSECLYSECDLNEWFVDEEGDFCHIGIHHDGHNYTTYRLFRKGITEDEVDEFTQLILDGKADGEAIDKYTRRLGDYIADIYGFDIINKKPVEKNNGIYQSY